MRIRAASTEVETAETTEKTQRKQPAEFTKFIWKTNLVCMSSFVVSLV